MKNISWQGHLAMFSANVMWGLMSPIAKIVMVGGFITPLLVTDIRLFGAMALFWIASIFTKYEKVPLKDLFRLFVASLLATVFNQGCFIFGVRYSTPGDASIITTSMPLWAMLLAAIVLKEPITWKKVCGIIAGAAGAIMLILGSSASSSAQQGSNPMLGDLLVLIAQFCYASYLVFYKNFVSKYSLVTIMKWLFTFGSLFVLPFSFRELTMADWSSFTLSQILGIVYIVVAGTFISYILIVVAQKRLRPTVAGMYNYVQPIVACIVAVCLGLDSFNVVKGFAVALIFGGVYLVTTSKSRQSANSVQG
jgi:drug/metabolite transporter (DMT)-like permease